MISQKLFNDDSIDWTRIITYGIVATSVSLLQARSFDAVQQSMIDHSWQSVVRNVDSNRPVKNVLLIGDSLINRPYHMHNLSQRIVAYVPSD